MFRTTLCMFHLVIVVLIQNVACASSALYILESEFDSLFNVFRICQIWLATEFNGRFIRPSSCIGVYLSQRMSAKILSLWYKPAYTTILAYCLRVVNCSKKRVWLKERETSNYVFQVRGSYYWFRLSLVFI